MRCAYFPFSANYYDFVWIAGRPRFTIGELHRAIENKEYMDASQWKPILSTDPDIKARASKHVIGPGLLHATVNATLRMLLVWAHCEQIKRNKAYTRIYKSYERISATQTRDICTTGDGVTNFLALNWEPLERILLQSRSLRRYRYLGRIVGTIAWTLKRSVIKDLRERLALFPYGALMWAMMGDWSEQVKHKGHKKKNYLLGLGATSVRDFYSNLIFLTWRFGMPGLLSEGPGEASKVMQNAGRMRNAKKQKNPFHWTMIYVTVTNLVSHLISNGRSNRAAQVTTEPPFKLNNIVVYHQFHGAVSAFACLLVACLVSFFGCTCLSALVCVLNCLGKLACCLFGDWVCLFVCLFGQACLVSIMCKPHAIHTAGRRSSRSRKVEISCRYHASRWHHENACENCRG